MYVDVSNFFYLIITIIIIILIKKKRKRKNMHSVFCFTPSGIMVFQQLTCVKLKNVFHKYISRDFKKWMLCDHTKSVVCSLSNSLNEVCTSCDFPGVTVWWHNSLRWFLHCFPNMILAVHHAPLLVDSKLFTRAETVC